eukprot:g7363.t1
MSTVILDPVYDEVTPEDQMKIYDQAKVSRTSDPSNRSGSNVTGAVVFEELRPIVAAAFEQMRPARPRRSTQKFAGYGFFLTNKITPTAQWRGWYFQEPFSCSQEDVGKMPANQGQRRPVQAVALGRDAREDTSQGLFLEEFAGPFARDMQRGEPREALAQHALPVAKCQVSGRVRVRVSSQAANLQAEGFQLAAARQQPENAAPAHGRELGPWARARPMGASSARAPAGSPRAEGACPGGYGTKLSNLESTDFTSFLSLVAL